MNSHELERFLIAMTDANTTAIAALMVAALSVSAALFLILELDRPFGGWIRISNQPMLNTLKFLGH